MKNRGTEFEKRLQAVHNVYAMNRVAKIQKVTPPALVIKGKMILMQNPWLDFAGTWTEQQGRTLIIEAKLTEKPTLDLCVQGGLSENQYSNLWAWSNAGAVVGLVWLFTEVNDIRLITLPMMATTVQGGTKRFYWGDAMPVPSRPGCPWDYLPLLKK